MSLKWIFSGYSFRNPLFRNAYELIIGTGINSGLGFLFWVIATELYSTDVIGLGSALISSLSLVAILAELGFGISLIRFLPTQGNRSNELMNTCFTSCGFAALIFSFVFIGVTSFLSPELSILSHNLALCVLFIVSAVALSAQPLVLNCFLAKQMTNFIVLANVTNSILKIIFLLVFSVIFSNVFGLLSAIGLSIILVVIINLYIELPKLYVEYEPHFTLNMSSLRSVWSYSIGNYFGRLLLQTTPLLLPLIVISVLGAECNAYYYMSWSFIAMAQIIPSSIFNSLFSECSNRGALSKTDITKTVKLMFLLLMPVIGTILLGAEWLLQLFGKNYAENGAMLLQLMILSVIPWGLNYLFISIERINKSTKGIVFITIVSSSIVLVMCSVLMETYGLVGLGIGYLCGQCFVGLGASVYIWWRYY